MTAVLPTLRSRQHPLSSSSEQLRVLQPESIAQAATPFEQALDRAGLGPLRACGIEVVQINVGKLCNQTCKHCHVDAGPDRTEENMAPETFDQCFEAIRRIGRPEVDITGGAPELNPCFRPFVERVRAAGCPVTDRCNLTVLTLRSQRDLAGFLADHEVRVVASLPYFLSSRTDAQRGEGVFAKSIQGLRKLNRLGYGIAGSGLELDLVYNPTGAFLPPDQPALEADFRRELRRRHGVEFNALFAMTNMPISRYLEFLVRTGNYERYMGRLVSAFNPAAVRALMCRTMISVGWDGRLYDCDFNQMLDLEVGFGRPRHIKDFDPRALEERQIVTRQHCYGCTAGSGSSCGGATA